jgi:hypothetical protein
MNEILPKPKGKDFLGFVDMVSNFAAAARLLKDRNRYALSSPTYSFLFNHAAVAAIRIFSESTRLVVSALFFCMLELRKWKIVCLLSARFCLP